MKAILQQINSVEGVMGSSVFTMRGDVLCHAFPAQIGATVIKQIADLSLHCVLGLRSADTLKSLEFRYKEGRIIFKACSGVILCLLCSINTNMHLLSITLNVIVKKLDLLALSLPSLTESTSPIPSHTEQVSGEMPLLLPVANLANRSASSSFDSLGMIAVTRSTFKYISDFYKTDFKKLVLFNAQTDTRGVFPVMVINDISVSFDSTIIVGPSVGGKLQVGKGDMLNVQIA